MQLKQLFSEDRGVSPVIGVILMVAITVILAAVIATFVLGLGDSVNRSATAGISVDQDTHEVTVTSLGSNTASVKCVNDNGGDVATGGTVGSTLSCSSGNNVVAVGSGDTENAVIRTNI